METIQIHLDFTVGAEDYVSYKEGLYLHSQGKGFVTHCTAFFSTDYPNAIVVNKAGGSIAVKHLLEDHTPYSFKEIRPEHNIEKILLAEGFNFLYPKYLIDEPKLGDLFASLQGSLLNNLQTYLNYLSLDESNIDKVLSVFSKIKVDSFYLDYLMQLNINARKRTRFRDVEGNGSIFIALHDLIVNVVNYKLKDYNSYMRSKDQINNTLSLLRKHCHVKCTKDLVTDNLGMLTIASNRFLQNYETSIRRDLKRCSPDIKMSDVPKVYQKAKREFLTYRPI